MKTLSIMTVILASVLVFSCEKEDDDAILDTNYNPSIKPENFVESVSNTYFPLVPGTEYTYRSMTEDGEETNVVTVLSEVRVVAGVSCTVVWDVVSIGGVVIEDTHDWYAEDTGGNVWYMGESVDNYENGVLEDHEGSFEAGIDGAKPGIIMLAHPVLELPYRQEYYFGTAEDWGKVIALDVTVVTPYGTFEHCLKTEDWNAIEPDAPVEYKYYAPGIGVVREEVSGTGEFMELINLTMP